MNLPTIDITSLPDLQTLTAQFGTLADAGRVAASDDSILIIIAFLAEQF